MVDFTFEEDIWKRGILRVAGIDEAGRGPLAGPVVAAAVMLPRGAGIEGVDDSKKLSARRREELFAKVTSLAVSYGVGIVSHRVIDEINIYQATLRAMADAVSQLSPPPQHLLVDGPGYRRESPIPFTAIVDGDAKCFSIAAASIVAKVARDRIMMEYDRLFPHYGFAQHKGYGTARHLEALRTYGPCEIHRRSFRLPAAGPDLR
jgi:ribonuclease HII